MEIFWSVLPSAPPSSPVLLLPLFLASSCPSSSIRAPSLAQITKRDPLLFNSNLRSISNQQPYIGNHQNLKKKKKANFRSLYIESEEKIDLRYKDETESLNEAVNLNGPQSLPQSTRSLRKRRRSLRGFSLHPPPSRPAPGSQPACVSHEHMKT
ncbi:unnamed protein product [Pleuronectes platessa]|uniref:Uncharacterized protein n=1 Tax=Pleuronectes platessa TaxID=8262 RepID=A0A9N7UEW8_PLEPL|nr:unnamed protein product [Pleuronectes platessa]